MEEKILNFLFEYRSSPLAHSNNSPANHMFRYRFRSNLNCLSKQVQSGILNREDVWESKKTMNTSGFTHQVTKIKAPSHFNVNDKIFYYYKPQRIWIKSTIISKISQNVYKIMLESGQILRSHVSYLRKDRTSLVSNSGITQELGPASHHMKLRSHVR